MEVLLEKLTEKGDLKMKTRNLIYLVGALLLALMFFDAVVDAVVRESQPAEIQASEQAGPNESVVVPDSFKEEYEKWMGEAEVSAGNGSISYVKAELKIAEWCVEDANIFEEDKVVMLKDFSERAEAIMLKLYKELVSDGLVNALRNAYGCNERLTRDYLKGFIFYSLKAGMEPDGKVERVEKILAESLAEREKSSKN